jgi:hypothetical protein
MWAMAIAHCFASTPTILRRFYAYAKSGRPRPVGVVEGGCHPAGRWNLAWALSWPRKGKPCLTGASTTVFGTG